jgi:amino-acid N-acetyltransferase
MSFREHSAFPSVDYTTPDPSVTTTMLDGSGGLRKQRPLVSVRRALLPDAVEIKALIEEFTGNGTLLPRSRAEICEHIRDFVVAEMAGKIVGCGALHFYGTHLAEIRSIAVRPWAHRNGAGRLLVTTLLNEVELDHVACVCLFTRVPEFFARMGFKGTVRQEFPEKIFKDCVSCPRQHKCDEVAMYRGQLPRFAVLEPSPELRVIQKAPQSTWEINCDQPRAGGQRT